MCEKVFFYQIPGKEEMINVNYVRNLNIEKERDVNTSRYLLVFTFYKGGQQKFSVVNEELAKLILKHFQAFCLRSTTLRHYEEELHYKYDIDV